MSELDQLRAELRDRRYLTEAVLMSIVGEKKMHVYEIEARVASTLKRRRRGTPLDELGVRGQAHDHLTSSYRDGMDVVTLEELAALPRDKVAAIDGLGRKTLEKIDAAMAERGLTFAEAS